MDAAIAEARQALAKGEVAVGCVFVDRTTQSIVARAHNKTHEMNHALAHAEFVALEQYDKSRSDGMYSIANLVLYVTVEPCIMCAAMLLYRRVGKVFFGCVNTRFGGNGTVLEVNGAHCGGLDRYESEGNHCSETSVKLLQQFYAGENESAPEQKRRRKNVTQ